MATTDEGKVKAAALKLYKKHKAKYDRAAATGMGRNGRPDDLVRRAGDGHFIAVEFKKLDVCKVTKLQQIWLDDCAAGGGSSLVINAENLWLLEWVVANPYGKAVAALEPAKEGAVCVGHDLYYPLGDGCRVPMNAPQPENLK